ncbi:glutamine amidotransferase [Actinotalea fermentans]|uniref:Glutamine amidotransferase n=1 Tax=Actinotalea fermentans TaxID=43671 RepID=A0A511YY54_9CELL|nr:glutamine amidotransferase [Actinotalea fermentans]KGM15041.1 glutamine amidotransferase [Actinotalea fermentans ATCC 43279 = JCM 9966 = DSM 3133]GEN80046.1 glutamine amidotransferase [Actinotalea fermentans]
MKPFVLLATRAEDEAADDEYEAMLRFGGLSSAQLRRIRLEAGPMPPIDLAEVSGVIVGGSPFTTSDPPEKKTQVQVRVEAELAALTREVLARETPFLGACYGVGTLGVVAGGVVDGTYAEPVGAVPVTLTDAGRADPVFGVLPRTFDAFVGHKEAVTVPPPGAVVLATSPGCPVQAFRLGSHQYATQFHPELDVAGIVTRIDVYRHAGYFAPDEVDALTAQVSRADVASPPLVLRSFVERYAR